MPPRGEQKRGPLSLAVDLITHVVLDVPGSVGEMFWRVFSTLGLSTLLITGFILWRHPDVIIRREASPVVAERLRRNAAAERETMANVSAFIRRFLPARFALVSWPTATTAETLWSSSEVDDWPASMDGMLSPNFIPAVGPLVFGECWRGGLSESENWLVCPIGNDSRAWGFVIAQWADDVPTDASRGLEHLAERIEGLLY